MELIVDRSECIENYSENHNGTTELSSLANTSYCLHSRVTEGPDTYIFDTVLNRDSEPTLAASLSTNIIELYSVEKFQKILSLTGHTKPITGIKFSSKQPCHLYSSSFDGKICLWDIRDNSKKPVQSYIDDTDEVLKPLASFDFSVDENFICAGTEIIREDAFLIFWDCRTSNILGGYWDSHTDDITQVKFHWDKPESMATASIDGLINFFDLRENSEEDALLQTFNIESSVSKVMWIPKEPQDMLLCITHIEELQIWNMDEASPSSLFDKDSMRKDFKVNIAFDYMIDTFLREGLVHLVTGTYGGIVHIWTINENELSLWTQLKGGHKGIVRTVSWNSQEDMIITGGEDGAVCCWKPGSQNLKSSSPSESWNKKARSHLRTQVTIHPKKPY